MRLQPRVVRAALEADAAFRLLDQHKQEFAGVDWMPANLFQRKRVVYLLNSVQYLYDQIVEVDYTDMVDGARLEQNRHQMWLDLRMANRWQVRDQLKFFSYISSALERARYIIEKLRKLALTGMIVRGRPETKQTPQYTLMD